MPSNANANAEDGVNVRALFNNLVNRTQDSGGTYNEPPPRDPEVKLITVIFVVPKMLEDVSLDDKIATRIFAQIRSQSKVWMEFGQLKKRLIILKGRKMDHIKEAISKVVKFLSTRQFIMSSPSFIIQPGSEGENYSVKVIPSSGPHKITRLAFAQTTLISIDDLVKQKCHEVFLDHFDLAFTRVAEQLSSTPNEMRMRVNFGRFQLSSWRKNDLAMDYQAFKQYLVTIGRRGCAGLHHDVGDGSMMGNWAILSRMFAAKDLFEPAVASVIKLDDTEPRKYIELQAGGFRLEMEITDLKACTVTSTLQHSEDGQGWVETGSAVRLEQCTSGIRAFRVDKSNEQVSVTAVCPSRGHDWNIRVEAETGLLKVPSSLRGLRKGVMIKRDNAADDRFPTPVIPWHIVKSAKVESIKTKTTWTIMTKASKYNVDITFVRDWTKLNTSVKPVESCAVSLYAEHWADDMRQRNVSENARDFGEDCCKLFPEGQTKLLDEIARIQALLEEI